MTDTNTSTAGNDNVTVELSTIDLTSPGDQKNATIIKQKITYYNTTLTHNQKIYTRWYEANLASNYIVHIINFLLGVLLSIQYYLPASTVIVIIASIVQIVLTSAYYLVYTFVFKSKINNFQIIVNSLNEYIYKVTVFYNKAVSGGTLTDSEMTDFNNLVAPLDKNLATEIQTANSNAVNISELIQDIKTKVDGFLEEIHVLKTTAIQSS
jgi:hypothetical protein